MKATPFPSKITTMKSQQLRASFLKFFQKKGHKILPSASLIPPLEVELTGTQKVLFTTAGIHPLIPFLQGMSHPEGARLANFQKCLRTDDIDQVGDTVHNTFFEMLGNWSLGDYWKEEAISWSFEFLTQALALPKERIFVSVFAGDGLIPFDEESYNIWKKLGLPKDHIFKYGKSKNWWGPVGATGSCGPDTEMFIDCGSGPVPNLGPAAAPERFVEIWNDVFMEYDMIDGGKLLPLKQKNVDTGMGLERTLMILQKVKSVYETDVFLPLFNEVCQQTKDFSLKDLRIIADHLKASVFLVSDGVTPSNIDRGYILRRLARRAIIKGKWLEDGVDFEKLVNAVIKIYSGVYDLNLRNGVTTIAAELEKFKKAMKTGMPQTLKVIEESKKIITGAEAFYLFASFGVPLDVILEIAKNYGKRIDVAGFEAQFEKHRRVSKTSAENFFGGLVEQTYQAAKLHTATHLLHQALRDVLGNQVKQTGSHITSERLRFDFTHNQKLTSEQIQKIEGIVNQKMKQGLPVRKKIMPKKKALEIGAIGLFGEKYGEQVSVYFIGGYSKEFCGGPHAANTKELGRFKIIKEETIGAQAQRIYARLEGSKN